MKELSFVLKLKEVSVRITDLDGQEHAFVLQELNGRDRDVYLDQMGDRMKWNVAGKTSGLKNYKGIQTGLLALCLYDENGDLVKKEALQGYPSSALSDMYDAATELSALDKGEEKNKDEKAKNDSEVKD